jgi:hypothetical protein
MMKRKNDHIAAGCQTWQPRIEHLFGLAPDDPERIAWIDHASACPACGRELAQEAEFQTQMSGIPDPGRAVIADAVLRRIRSRRYGVLTVKPRDIAWGFAGSLAGIILGLWIAGAAPKSSQTTATDQYTGEFAELQDDLDAFTWELVSGAEEL